MNWVANALLSIGSFLAVINWISALFLHVLTIIVAYKASGIVAAAVTLIFPVISTMYWFVAMWIKTGSAFDNSYGRWVGVLLLYFVVSIGLLALGSSLKRDK